MNKDQKKAVKALEKAKKQLCKDCLDGVAGDMIARCDDLIAQTRGGLCNPVTGEGCD